MEMEDFRNMLMEKKINEAQYRNYAVRFTLKHLAEEGHLCMGCLGSGSFGSVAKIKHRKYGDIAAKVVLREYSTSGEVMFWQTLKHENLLPLIGYEYVPTASTFVFFMPKQPCALDELLEKSAFAADINGFRRALTFLLGIFKGVEYLHEKSYCHLDIKLSNVLVSQEDIPVICDFGALTRTDGSVKSYASPFIFRPPEAFIDKKKGMAEVNGFAFDIWSLGMLTIELFSKQAVCKSPQWVEEDPTWADVMYPRIYDILQKKTFEKGVKETFRMSDITKKVVNNILNVIRGCMSLNPRSRPSVGDVLAHELFGGVIVFDKAKKDLWMKKAMPEAINVQVSKYIEDASGLYTPTESGELKVTPEDENVESSKDEPGNVDSKIGEPAVSDFMSVQNMKNPSTDVENSLPRRKNFRQWISKKKMDFRRSIERVFRGSVRNGKYRILVEEEE